MPANTIREQTFCCGSGAGLNAGEDMELRMAGGLPRPMRSSMSTNIRGEHAGLCLRHRPRGLPDPWNYWVPEVDVTGLHELVANALICPAKRSEKPTCAASRCREWRSSR
jgi:hypothetical protein